MTRRLLSFLGSIGLFTSSLVALPRPATPQTSAARAECREWHECRQLALDALARGEHERFHDLAWRTVQTGPARDPDLMYLLARAQSLSGRPHDALVMLDRLADMGIATDPATNDDFKLVRTLKEWPDLDAKIRALAASGAKSESAAPAAAVAPGTPARVTPPESVPEPVAKPEPVPTPEEAPPPDTTEPVPAAVAAGTDAVRVAGLGFKPHGLAYDSVSSRFVVADPDERKLVIFDQRSNRAIDLVRASSAGFGAIDVFAIDPRRGDLWVLSASASAENGTGTSLHKLQLVSGRQIDRFAVPDSFDHAAFDDVAVTPGGTVLMLDAAGRRIVAFDQGSKSFSVAAKLDVDGAASLAPVDDRSVYVAVADGLVHVDLATRAASRIDHGSGLAGLKRIRWSHGALVAVQQRPDGSYGVVEVRIRNRRASMVPVAGVSVDDPTALTLDASDLYVLTHDDGNLIVRKIRLR